MLAEWQNVGQSDVIGALEILNDDDDDDLVSRWAIGSSSLILRRW